MQAIADADAKHRLAVAAADAATGMEELSLSQVDYVRFRFPSGSVLLNGMYMVAQSALPADLATLVHSRMNCTNCCASIESV